MDSHRITGTVKEVAGKAEETFGSVTGDRSTELTGATRKIAGQIEGAYGETIDTVRSSVEHSPMLAIALTAGASFLLGALVSSVARASTPPAPRKRAPARR